MRRTPAGRATTSGTVLLVFAALVAVAPASAEPDPGRPAAAAAETAGARGACHVDGRLQGKYGVNGAYGTCTGVRKFQIIVYCPGGINSVGNVAPSGGRSGARCRDERIMRSTGPTFNTW